MKTALKKPARRCVRAVRDRQDPVKASPCLKNIVASFMKLPK